MSFTNDPGIGNWRNAPVTSIFKKFLNHLGKLFDQVSYGDFCQASNKKNLCLSFIGKKIAEFPSTWQLAITPITALQSSQLSFEMFAEVLEEKSSRSRGFGGRSNSRVYKVSNSQVGTRKKEGQACKPTFFRIVSKRGTSRYERCPRKGTDMLNGQSAVHASPAKTKLTISTSMAPIQFYWNARASFPSDTWHNRSDISGDSRGL